MKQTDKDFLAACNIRWGDDTPPPIEMHRQASLTQMMNLLINSQLVNEQYRRILEKQSRKEIES